MINNVVLVGRLTKDPELRYAGSNNLPTINFTLAINRTFADQNGQRQADFISCVVFRKQAENMAKYVAKGHQVGVVGRIQTRNYQGNDGKTVYITEVICDNIQYLENKNNNQDNGFNNAGFANNNGFNNFNQNMNNNSNFADFGQDFPSGNDDDFLKDINNPFK